MLAGNRPLEHTVAEIFLRWGVIWARVNAPNKIADGNIALVLMGISTDIKGHTLYLASV